MDQELVSITEASRRLHVPRTILARRIRAAGIPAFANPLDLRVTLVSMADLEAFQPGRPLERKELKELAAA